MAHDQLQNSVISECFIVSSPLESPEASEGINHFKYYKLSV